MNFLKKIKQTINSIFLSFRQFFIREKKPYITARTFDNINFSFKNIQVYSEISIYKTIISLFFILIFLIITIYFVYRDFKINVAKNKELIKIEPIKIVIKNPIETDLPQDYKELTYKIRKNDNLIKILTNTIKIKSSDVYDCINKLSGVFDIKTLKPNQKIFIKYKDSIKVNSNSIENELELNELKIINDDSLEEIIISKNINNTFDVKKEKIKLTQAYNKYIIKIFNSVYTDAIRAGIPTEIISNIINYYSFDVDFQRDIKKGDWLEVVFEALYTENGRKIKNGDIIYANLHVNSKDNKIYRFDNNENKGYFNENGISTQKSLLKTPINGARISSGYTNRRKHPVLGYTTAHRGIDFAAPTGTPFYAAGNGTVKKIITGCKDGDRRCGGGFGNYISIKHNNNYTTEYAHISKIASNIKVGSKVKQGDIIAYVGNTGISTGSHLHYGIIFNGERINPAKIRSMPLKRLSGKALLNFIETRNRINSLKSTTLNQSMLEND